MRKLVIIGAICCALVGCGERSVGTGTDSNNGSYDARIDVTTNTTNSFTATIDSYDARIDVTTNTTNSFTATISGGNLNRQETFPLTFTAPNNSIQFTMTSAYVNQAGELRIQLVTPTGDTTFTEDIDVNGSINRAIYMKAEPLPNKVVISAVNFYGSLGMTLQPYAN